MLNLQEILSFIEVSKAQGFTNASRKTGLPKSTLSRHVQNLEERLALHLFKRSTRRLTLTPAGEDFFRRSQGLIDDFENLEKHFQGQSQRVDGTLKITCAVEVGSYLLPPLIESFQRLYPEVNFDVYLSDETTNLIDAKIDLAIRAGYLSDSSIICKKVLEHQFKLYAHPKKVTSLEKQNKEVVPLIEFSTKPFHKLEFFNGRKKLRFTQAAKFFSNSLRMNAELAIQGLGICILPSFMGESYCEKGLLKPVFQDWGTKPHPLHLLYTAQAHLPSRLRLFIDHLTSEISKTSSSSAKAKASFENAAE